MIASDIGDRIKELGEVLGLKQKALAKRAGVWPAQVSNWVTKKQKPPRRRLEEWAAREGWPVTIFTEGGKRPGDVVNRPVNVSESAEEYLPVNQLRQSAQTAIRLQVQNALIERLYAEGDSVPTSVAVRAVLDLSDAWGRWEATRSEVARPDSLEGGQGRRRQGE